MDQKSELRDVTALQQLVEDLIAHGLPTDKDRLTVSVGMLEKIEVRLDRLKHGIEDQIRLTEEFPSSATPPL